MKYLIIVLSVCALPALADVNIVGNVAAKCIIQTDTSGVYGNPTATKLSTAAADGGVLPIVRYDVAVANYYTARITHPTSFSSSPSLSDTVAWTGASSVAQTSDAGMAAYDAAKVVYDSTTNFNLTIAGSTWFKTASTATYGVSKAFPGGSYTAIVQASCIAN
tara:strand:+ start:435 stop:923 length:489 start_codon:yes stop_codon:yes gene_type:complete